MPKKNLWALAQRTFYISFRLKVAENFDRL
jgi:hypothetical protein